MHGFARLGRDVVVGVLGLGMALSAPGYAIAPVSVAQDRLGVAQADADANRAGTDGSVGHAHGDQGESGHPTWTPRTLRSFNKAQLDWMAAHPVVRFTVDPDWAPLEYVEDGRPSGLMVEYLNALKSFVPLRFEYVPSASWHDSLKKFERGDVDLISSTSLTNSELHSVGPILNVLPYYIGTTIVVAPADHPMVLEAANLTGLRVGVVQDDDAHSYLRSRLAPESLFIFPTADTLLLAVSSGVVEVGVGPELVLLPLMGRLYRGQLATAGTLLELPVAQRMLVHGDAAMLKSVLDSALLGLTAGETDAIGDRWVSTLEHIRPSYAALLRYYRTEAMLALVVAMFLASTVWFAWYLRRRAQRDAERKLRFLATVSHEIRNSMNAVVGPLEVLPGESDADKRAALIQTAHHGARVLLETVSGLLDLSTLRARKAQVARQATDVDALVAQVLDLLRPGCSQDIRLTHRTPLKCNVMLDAGKYRQVLMNLLTNALKFTTRGEISVQTELRETPAGCQLSTAVRDTGCGIADHQLDAIFEPYRQGHDDTVLLQADLDSPKRGSGLGLAICRELVTLQGGTLYATSQPGEGSVFTFVLPAARVQHAAKPLEHDAQVYVGRQAGATMRAVYAPGDRVRADPGSTLDAGSDPAALLVGGGARLPVLVVDDNPVNLMVLRSQLDRLGWPVVTCRSGEQALQAWQTSDFSLALLDCTMPGMDGYELARRMREYESRLARPPSSILAVSARNDEPHRQACFDSGMDDVLLKPVDMAQLRRVAAHWAREADGQGVAMAPAAVDTVPDDRHAAATSMPDAAPTGVLPPDADPNLIRLLIDTNAVDLAAIYTARAASDAGAVARLAHRVAGAAWVMQIDSIAQVAQGLHDQAAAALVDWVAVDASIEGLAQGMATLSQAVQDV